MTHSERYRTDPWQAWLAFLPALFPLYLVRFSVGPVPTTLAEVLIVGTALATLVARRDLLDARRLLPRGLPWWQQPLWPALLILIGATVGALIVPAVTAGLDGPVEARRIALGVWKGFVAGPFLYWLLAMLLERTEAWKTRALRAFADGGIVLALWALWQAVTGTYTTFDSRAAGPFESANYLSLYLTPVAVGAALMARRAAGTAGCRGWTLAAVLLIAGLACSRSYAGLAATAVGIGAGLLLDRTLTLRTKARAVGAVAAVSLLVLVSQIGTDKFQRFFDTAGPTSTHIRLQIYQVSTRLALTHPLLGIGLGQFETQWPLTAPTVLGDSPIDWVVLHPHNLYLAFWLNAGLMGLLGPLWLSWLLVRRGRAAHTGTLAGVGLAMLVAVLAYGFVDTPFWKNDLALSWWLIAALVL